MKLTPIRLRTTQTHTTNQSKNTQPRWLTLILLLILSLTGTLALAAYWTRPSLAAWGGQMTGAGSPLNQAWKKLAAAVTATPPKTGAATALAGTISGTVYRDWNSNGSQDAASTGRVAEPGVAGVTVTAYNALGANAGSTTTGASGGYSLTTTDTGSGPYRVEFTTLPPGAFSGPFGPQSGTTVQFVSATPATNVNLGVNNPEDYCQPNPMLAVPCYVSGDPLKGGTAAGADVVVGFPYNAGSSAAYDGVNVPPGGDLPKPSHLATAVQLGAAWGEAYQRNSKKVFVAAVTRRHSGFGPLGLGGIYTVTNPTGAATVANFIDVNTIGINVGTLTNAQRNLPAAKDGQSADPLAFDAVGKMGIGDLDLSADEKTLWLTNLNDRRVYSIFINDPPVTPTAANVRAYTLPAAGCNGGDFRPWGLKYNRGKVYVGGVCTAENSQNRDDLRATVYELDPASGAFTEKLSFPLNFTRGIIWVWPGVTDRRFWQPWTSDFNKLIAPAEDTPNRDFLIYPQPILSDIEFDHDGTIILGFMDRTGMQTGYVQFDVNGNVPPGPGTSGNGTEGYEGISGGDIMRAFNNNGTFVLEQNGIVGSNTGAPGNGQGPGGGEFYFQDDFTIGGGLVHQEITLGSLALLPNTGQVVTPIFDPFTVRSGGIVWFNNSNGRSDRRYEVFPKPPTELDRPGTFGKAAGLGDLELLCDAAPLELGNRIWTDLNGNGIQDANEPGLGGLMVQLYKGGQLVGTATTNATGNYYFNATNVPGGVLPNMAYEIRVDKAQTQLGSTILTARDADSGANGDARDSDAAMVGNNAVITLTTGGAGQNDHTYDIGFQPLRVDLSLTKAVTAPPAGGYAAGQRITYTLVVTNATDCTRLGVYNGPCTTANEVTVEDVLPPALTFLAATPATAYNATTGIWTVGTLAPGASATLTIEASIVLGSTGSIRNYAQVKTQTGPLDIDSTPGNGITTMPPREDDEAEVTITLSSPRVDLSLTKAVSAPPTGGYMTGQRITYTLVVSNATDCTRSGVFTGPCSTANDVTVQDVLPPGLTFLAATPATAYNATTGIWTVGTLAPGASATLQIEASITNSGNGSIRNYAQVQTQTGPPDIDSTPGNGNPALPPREDDEAEVTISVQSPRVDLSLTKTVNPPQTPSGYLTGHRIIYTLVVSNATDCTRSGVFTGPCSTANDVTVQDVLPPGLTFLAATPSTAYNATTGIWTVGTLAPGASATLQIEASISNNGGGSIRNYAQVQTQTGPQDIDSTPGNGNPALPPREDDEAEVTITVVAPRVDLSLTKAVNPPPVATGYPTGHRLIYTLVVTNASDCTKAGVFTGPCSTATDVTVQDVLPPGLTFLAATPATAYNATTGIWTVGTLAPGASATLRIEAAISNNAGSMIRNYAQVQTQSGPEDIDSTPGNGNPALPPREDDEAEVKITINNAMLGDFVWQDLNANGCQDANEPGVAGVTVRLFDGSGTQLNSTATNGEGRYFFSGLSAGDYYVIFTLPSGATFSPAKQCNNDATDSDANPATGQTQTITLAAGQSFLNLDAGIYQTSSIGDYVFKDANLNGVQDDGPANGVNGVKVKLCTPGPDGIAGNGDDVHIASATTSNNSNGQPGYYLFTGVLPGRYYLQFDKGTLPAGGEFIRRGPTGVKDAADSDPDPATGLTEIFTVANGENDLSWDAGILCRACLSGNVYVDANDNGVKDAGESGIGNVVVSLTGTDFAGGAVSTAVNTNPDGTYQFCDLLPGVYKVTETQPQDYLDGKDSVGSAGGDLSNDMVSNIRLGNGANAVNYNFGEKLPFDLAIRKEHIGNFSPGGIETYTLTVRNAGLGPVPGPITVTDDLPGGMTYVSGTGTGWTCNGGVGNSNVRCTNPGPLAAGAQTIITLRVRIASGIGCSVVNYASVATAAAGDSDTRNNTARDTTIIGDTANCQRPDAPGLPGMGSQQPASLLIYPVYTSDATNPARENTQVCITNTSTSSPVIVHFFFVDGSTCAVADNFLCLTPSQTACFTTADIDPGTMGYIVAVAVDDQGCPIKFNHLIGSEYVKFNSGHFGNLVAEGFPADLDPGTLPGGSRLPGCDPNSPTAVLNLDGAQYAKAARVLASSSILSPADGNSSLLVLLRSGGSLLTGGASLGSIFGILYDDTENSASFSFSSNACQLKTILSNSFPRTTPRFANFIPAGRTGWLKLWADRPVGQSSNVGLVGALFNFNPNGGAYNGGRGLHRLTLTNEVYTIPVFPPSC